MSPRPPSGASGQPRVPEGVPTGGQFTASERGQADVTLTEPAATPTTPAAPTSVGYEQALGTWLSHGDLAIGEWVESDGVRFQMVPATEDPAEPSEPGEPAEPTVAVNPEPGPEPEPEAGQTPALGQVPTLVLRIQVRADHPDAGDPDPDTPGWGRPASAPPQAPRVPAHYAATASRRAALARFALRQVTNLGGDMKAAWRDFSFLIEEATPRVR